MNYETALTKKTKALKKTVAKNGDKPIQAGSDEMAALLALACRAPKRK